MQFNIVVCGLDSIEARRWINSTLVDMVDLENHESLKPLIDGGTEGTECVGDILGNDANGDTRLQGSVPCDLPNNDFMYRMPTRHACTTGRRSSLYVGNYPTTTRALH